MKSTDLMIGNWVFDWKLSPTIIVEIIADEDLDEYYKPIPITEEILTNACGFLCDPYADSYYTKPSTITLDVDKTRGFLDLSWKGLQIKTLHHLQNLCAVLSQPLIINEVELKKAIG